MLHLKRISALLLALLLIFSLFACSAELPNTPTAASSPAPTQSVPPSVEPDPIIPVQEGAPYYDPDSVVLYLYYYGELPPNFITKDEARELGWSAIWKGPPSAATASATVRVSYPKRTAAPTPSATFTPTAWTAAAPSAWFSPMTACIFTPKTTTSPSPSW